MLYSRTVMIHNTLLRLLALGAAVTLLAGCMMPDPEKRAAENETRLAAAGITALKAGDPAPQFSALDQDGASVSPLPAAPAISILEQASTPGAMPENAPTPAGTTATPPSATAEPAGGQPAAEPAGGNPPATTGATPAAAGPGCVVLFFFPALNAPNGTAELLAMNKSLTKLAALNISVYAISPGTPEENKAFCGRYKIGYPLLSDHSLLVARAYGCSAEGAEFMQRTLVGVGPDGKIAFYTRAHTWMSNPAKYIGDKLGLTPVAPAK